MKETAELKALRGQVLEILNQDHIGKEKAIGMGELYEKVYGKRWQNRISDTRPLRHVITDLRLRRNPVCSHGGGYYIPSVKSELKEYLDRRHKRAVKELAIEAAMRKMALSELCGQMALFEAKREVTGDGQQGKG